MARAAFWVAFHVSLSLRSHLSPLSKCRKRKNAGDRRGKQSFSPLEITMIVLLVSRNILVGLSNGKGKYDDQELINIFFPSPSPLSSGGHAHTRRDFPPKIDRKSFPRGVSR